MRFSFKGALGDAYLTFLLFPIVSVCTFGLMYPWTKLQQRTYLVENLFFGATPFRTSLKQSAFYPAYFYAILANVVVLSLWFSLPLVELDSLREGQNMRLSAVLWFVVPGFIFTTSLIILRAVLAKIVWNNTVLGPYSFEYSIKIHEYFWITFSNWLLKIFTLGLASPFCAVRIYKYQMDHLSLVGPKNLGHFTAVCEQELRAMGEQAAELYDMDVDLGF